MKKLLVVFFALGMFTFISCSKDEVAEVNQEVAAHEGTANGDITTTGSSTSSSQDGEVDTYPAAIDEYVAANYPDATIEEVELEDSGEYEVELDNDIELIFDAEGNFLEVEVEDDDDEEEEDDGDDDDEIDPADLPQVILDYISANYTDASIEEAELEEEGYEVELDNGVELLFDLDGSFIGEETDDDDDDDGDNEDDTDGGN